MAGNKKTGRCFCGTVELSASGESVTMGYCHCKDCAKWSAAPINSYSFWRPDQVEITKGKEHIQTFSKTSHSKRKFCKKCGGHLMTEHPDSNFIDILLRYWKIFSLNPPSMYIMRAKLFQSKTVYQSSKICLKNLTVLEKFYQSENSVSYTHLRAHET